jgi:tetratricopeptide (TPR) repeat protein
LFLILFFSAFYVNAQKSKVQTAYNYYREPYQQYDKAKEAIDEAILNEQSKGMAKTWYYRGLIYQSLFQNEKYGNLCDNCLMTAFEAFRKANEIDPKNEWEEEINSVRIPLIANKIFANGVAAFQSKDFKSALADFETVKEMSPNDTSVILNCAYSAERAGDFVKAKNYYSQLIGMKYPDDNIYVSLANLLKSEKDTSSALKTVREGRVLFPDSINLMLAEINLLLATGRNEEATQALDVATRKDPNNPSLFLALGSTFDNLANPRDEKQKELPKSADYDKYMVKAEESYKKGLAISPDNYELNYNLGAMYFNQAAEMANKANNLKSNEEYNKAKEKFDSKFKDAEPYLEKAMETNPRKTEEDLQIYDGTLNSLKQLYVRMGEMEKYNKIKVLLEGK